MKNKEVYFGPFISLIIFLESVYGLYSLVTFGNIGTVGFICVIVCAYGLFLSLAHLLYYGDRVLDKLDCTEQTQLYGAVLFLFLFGSVLFTATGVVGVYNSIIALFILIAGMAFLLSYLENSGMGSRMNTRIGAIKVAKLQSVPFWMIAVVVTALFILLGVSWH